MAEELKIIQGASTGDRKGTKSERNRGGYQKIEKMISYDGRCIDDVHIVYTIETNNIESDDVRVVYTGETNIIEGGSGTKKIPQPAAAD